MLLRKKATLDHFQGKQAVLVLENGQELLILKEELGKTAEIGSQYVISILPQEEAVLEQEQLARTLLNQLLSDHGQS